jgi:enamidase
MSARMGTILIKNIGQIVTGDLTNPRHPGSAIYVEDGVIRALGDAPSTADMVVDARGLTAIPGLIDGHVHPLFGEWAPPQEVLGWVRAYLNGGMTTLISAGELHLPGLPIDPPDPKIFKYLAIVAHRCNLGRPAGVKMVAGTIMLAPGMTEADFDEIAAEGIRLAKFIFYPYGATGDEGQRYVRWCHARGIKVKIHAGGVSRSGASRPAGFAVIRDLGVDIAGHITGGPIPMPEGDMERVVNETECFLEIASAGNYRMTMRLIEMVRRKNALPRVTLGSDTPSGTGILPRGMLRNMCFLSSVCGLTPEEAVCVGTGNTADAHGLPQGRLAPSRPADIVLMGKITASVAKDALDALRLGDLPGISMVFVDGAPLVRHRSDQTPPPAALAVIEKGA